MKCRGTVTHRRGMLDVNPLGKAVLEFIDEGAAGRDPRSVQTLIDIFFLVTVEVGPINRNLILSQFVCPLM